MKKEQRKRVAPPLQYTNVKYMTHVKTAASYSRLVDICTGLGGNYNPGHEFLQVEVLVAQQKEVKKALELVIAAKAHFDTVANERKQVFQALSRLVASILRMLETSGASAETVEDARAFVHQFMGVSAKRREPAPAEGAVPVSKRSTLQLAYVSKADSFAKLVKVIANETRYKANEAHLSVSGLNEKLKELQALNERVSDARVRWSYARIHRNEVMYGDGASMRRTALAARKYVRALFGLPSEQYALLKALRFTKPGNQ